jgi:hypothetical protein
VNADPGEAPDADASDGDAQPEPGGDKDAGEHAAA